MWGKVPEKLSVFQFRPCKRGVSDKVGRRQNRLGIGCKSSRFALYGVNPITAHEVRHYFFPAAFGTPSGTTSRPLSLIANSSSLIANRRTSLSRSLFAATIGFLAFLR